MSESKRKKQSPALQVAFWIYDKLLFSEAPRVKGDWGRKSTPIFVLSRPRMRSEEEWAKYRSECSKFHVGYTSTRSPLRGLRQDFSNG